MRSLSERSFNLVISGFRDLTGFVDLHGSSGQGRHQALRHFDVRDLPCFYSLKVVVDFVLFFLVRNDFKLSACTLLGFEVFEC